MIHHRNSSTRNLLQCSHTHVHVIVPSFHFSNRVPQEVRALPHAEVIPNIRHLVPSIGQSFHCPCPSRVKPLKALFDTSGTHLLTSTVQSSLQCSSAFTFSSRPSTHTEPSIASFQLIGIGFTLVTSLRRKEKSVLASTKNTSEWREERSRVQALTLHGLELSWSSGSTRPVKDVHRAPTWTPLQVATQTESHRSRQLQSHFFHLCIWNLSRTTVQRVVMEFLNL